MYNFFLILKINLILSTILFTIFTFNLNCLDKKIVNFNNLPSEIQYLIAELVFSPSDITRTKPLNKTVKTKLEFLKSLAVNKNLNAFINSPKLHGHLVKLLAFSQNLNILSSVDFLDTLQAYKWLNKQIPYNQILTQEAAAKLIYRFRQLVKLKDKTNKEQFEKWEKRCQLIIENCIRSKVFNKSDQSIFLNIAIITNRLNLAKLLIESKVDINARDHNDSTALMLAVINNNKKLSRLLIESGADTNVQNNKGKTALHYAILQNKTNKKIVKLLIRSSADVNLKDNNGETALHYSLSKKKMDTKLINILIDSGADVDAQNNNGSIALHYILFRHKVNIELARLLIRLGANINAQNNHDLTALLLAIISGNVQLVNILIESGADVKIQNNNGYTALMTAVMKKDLDLVKLLVKAGSDINAQADNGNTALTLSENQEITAFLQAELAKNNQQ